MMKIKIIEIKAKNNMLKIDVLMSEQTETDGLFEATENNTIHLQRGQSFIGLVDDDEDNQDDD